MASVNDYVSEKILTYKRLALYSLKLVNIPIVGDLIKKKLQKTVRSFEPALIDMKTASELIRGSGRCAVGERVCRKIHEDSVFTESVFLNELAEGMVKAGKARYVTENDAMFLVNTWKYAVHFQKCAYTGGWNNVTWRVWTVEHHVSENPVLHNCRLQRRYNE